MYTTPGVYFEQVDRGRPFIGPLRTDIAGFAGYTERGPLLAPVKVTSWRQFTAVFGTPLSYAHLAYAVRGFFDNGGAVCYVVRVADPDKAQAASIILSDYDGGQTLRLFASHGELCDPVTGEPQVEDGNPRRYDSRGAWGNRLSVSVQSAGLGNTEGSQSSDGLTSYVASLSGFVVGSVVRVSQEKKGEANEYRRIDAINAHRRQITWNAPLTDLRLPSADDSPIDLDQPIRLESVEFTIFIHQDGQIVERHLNLSLSETHPRYIVDVIRADSRLVDIKVLLDLEAGDWQEPRRWPAPADRLPLTGGQDGLATVDKEDFLAALATLEKVDEVSLLAAPDAVLEVEVPAPGRRAESVTAPCEVLEPPPDGKLWGFVLDESDGSYVNGVEIRLPGSDPVLATTGKNGEGGELRDGEFELTGLPLGRVALWLERDGYYSLEVMAQTYLVLPAKDKVEKAARFFLTPITLPPTLSPDDIFEVQAAMIGQGERGLYRVALLDPPQTMLGLEQIQTWRARFDSAYAALYYPWLIVQDERGSGVHTVPPSGHVAGLIARTDLTQGVHRAPANYVLEGVKALTHGVDDAQQGVLNPLGINCLRVLPGRGIRVYGARTLSSEPEWRYLNVRRLVLMIEEAIEKANQWAVFEPNNLVLRQTLVHSLRSFLDTIWRQGALAGDTPDAAFQVKCDEDNNPPDIVDAGQVIAEIGVAPTIPFEFVKFRLGRTVEAVQVTE